VGSKEKFKGYELPEDLAVLQGDAAEEYADYLGACQSVDENLGRLISKLKEKNLYDNTIIVFTSDHGSPFRTRNHDPHLNGYDDYKRTCHDSALRVPLVISGGFYTGGLVVSDLVSTAALPKSLLAMAGIDVGDAMIGEDLLDVVIKKNPDRTNEVYAQISESRVGRVIRTASYKYAICAPGLNGGITASHDVYVDDFLYDLRQDPFELDNMVNEKLYGEHKNILREKLLDWILRTEVIKAKILE